MHPSSYSLTFKCQGSPTVVLVSFDISLYGDDFELVVQLYLTFFLYSNIYTTFKRKKLQSPGNLN